MDWCINIPHSTYFGNMIYNTQFVLTSDLWTTVLQLRNIPATADTNNKRLPGNYWNCEEPLTIWIMIIYTCPMITCTGYHSDINFFDLIEQNNQIMIICTYPVCRHAYQA